MWFENKNYSKKLNNKPSTTTSDKKNSNITKKKIQHLKNQLTIKKYTL